MPCILATHKQFCYQSAVLMISTLTTHYSVQSENISLQNTSLCHKRREQRVYMSCTVYTHGEDVNKWPWVGGEYSVCVSVCVYACVCVCGVTKSLRAEQSPDRLHTVPSLFKRASLISTSCPCYVNPALETTRPRILIILELLPAVQRSLNLELDLRVLSTQETAESRPRTTNKHAHTLDHGTA